MIYIVWKIDEDLEPMCTAFENEEDALAYMKQVELDIERFELDDRIFRFGMWKLPFASSQAVMTSNISKFCN